MKYESIYEDFIVSITFNGYMWDTENGHGKFRSWTALTKGQKIIQIRDGRTNWQAMIGGAYTSALAHCARYRSLARLSFDKDPIGVNCHNTQPESRVFGKWIIDSISCGHLHDKQRMDKVDGDIYTEVPIGERIMMHINRRLNR